MIPRLLIVALLSVTHLLPGRMAAEPRQDDSPDLELHLSAKAEARMAFDEAGIKVSITSRGRTVVTLVTPETGSEIGMRTPIIKWRVIQVTDTGDRDVTPETGIGDFYIILRADDVWDLPPGATKSLHLLPGLIPDVAGPGQ